MKGRAKTANPWLRRHLNDHWVQQAQAQGYRSRAAFKLLEIDRKDRLFRQGMTVVDLGAAPGSWSQVACRAVGAQGRVIALDRLPMAPIPSVQFIVGDLCDEGTLHQLQDQLQPRSADLVICDLAPNLTGNRFSDQANSHLLNSLALRLAGKCLVRGGGLLVKTFQGEDYRAFRGQMEQQFEQVWTRKPQASRTESAELYLVAKRFVYS